MTGSSILRYRGIGCYNHAGNPGSLMTMYTGGKMAVQTEFLAKVPYFSGLGTSELDEVKRAVFEKMVVRGEVILFEDEPAKELYFVTSGVVKVFKTSADGKEQILQLIRPGESFNDVPVFSGGTNLASAAAMGSVVLYGLRKSDLEVILRSIPRVARNLIQVLSQRVQQLLLLVEDLSFRNVIGRVARLLLEYAADGSGERPRLTQQEMAAIAGTAREMVGRSLKVLEGEGAIRLDNHRIIVVDSEALQRRTGTAW